MIVTVEVFTLPNCGACTATKGWLNRHGIKFVEKDAQEYADFLALLHHKQAPVVIVYRDGKNRAGDHWGGYKPDLLAKHLGDFQ